MGVEVCVCLGVYWAGGLVYSLEGVGWFGIYMKILGSGLRGIIFFFFIGCGGETWGIGYCEFCIFILAIFRKG